MAEGSGNTVPAAGEPKARAADEAGLDLFEYVQTCAQRWYVLVGLPIFLAAAALAWQLGIAPRTFQVQWFLQPTELQRDALEAIAGSGKLLPASPSVGATVSRQGSLMRIVLSGASAEAARGAFDPYRTGFEREARHAYSAFLQSKAAVAKVELGKVREQIQPFESRLVALQGTRAAVEPSAEELRARLRETVDREVALLKAEAEELRKRLKPDDPLVLSRERRAEDLRRAGEDAGKSAVGPWLERQRLEGVLADLRTRESQLLRTIGDAESRIEAGALPYMDVIVEPAAGASGPYAGSALKASLYGFVTGLMAALVGLGFAAWHRKEKGRRA